MDHSPIMSSSKEMETGTGACWARLLWMTYAPSNRLKTMLIKRARINAPTAAIQKKDESSSSSLSSLVLSSEDSDTLAPVGMTVGVLEKLWKGEMDALEEGEILKGVIVAEGCGVSVAEEDGDGV